MTEHTAPGETKIYQTKKDYFENLAFSHLSEMRLLFRGGKLTKRDKWRNIAEHCLVQIAVADSLSDLLGLSSEEKADLIKVAACHDWAKRLEKSPGDFTEEEKTKAKNFLERVDPRQNLMAATEPDFQEKYLKGESSFLERLQSFIDNIVLDSDIVEHNRRIDETEKRDRNLAGASLVVKLGSSFFDGVREFGDKFEQELFTKLSAPVRYQIGEPKNIPLYLRQQIENKWQKPVNE